MTFQARITTAFNEENARRKAEGEPRLTQTDLWKAAGRTSAAATFWFRGSNGADLDTCMKIAPLLRVSPIWLFDGSRPKHLPRTRTDANDKEYLPVLMVDVKASAGKGTLVFSEHGKKTLQFRRDYLAKHDVREEGESLVFEVDGDSMIDLHIPAGSVVVANRKKRDPISRRVYVLWLDGQLCVKQVVKSGGRLWARSHNKEKAHLYPDIPIENGDRIEGQVFWCGFDL